MKTKPQFKVLRSDKTSISFVVERILNGVLVARYENDEMAACRHCPKPFDQAVIDVEEELKCFEKNPLTQVQNQTVTDLHHS